MNKLNRGTNKTHNAYRTVLIVISLLVVVSMVCGFLTMLRGG